MIIDKITKFKIKGNDNAKFQSIDEYSSLAKRQIACFASKKVKNSLLRDEDAISYVAYANMLADWRYDPTKGVSPVTYRIGYAIGFIKTLTSKFYKSRNVLSINKDNSVSKENGMMSLDETISDKDQFNLLDVFVENHQKHNQRWTEGDIQSSIDKLKERDKKILKMYLYEDKNLAEIGRELSISRERVRQIMSQIMITLKKELEHVEQG